MRTLTATLAAAQKKAHRLPYIEAKVYDYEQGIKRLSWTRVYEGTEPDNHHGIAFDGQGSMHRIRSAPIASGLYYQKQTLPWGEPATFPLTFPVSLVDGPALDQWTQIASDCDGPCAIAAYGAKVYIFYRTSTNVLWKLYSHNYGDTWDNAQLIAVANVLSMAACWKGTTSTVVCFAATSIKISAIVLDTTTQGTAEHYYNHALDTTYGIGATYQGSEFPIILAAKETDSGTGIVTYSLYATKLSALYNFMALRVLLSAQDDVSTLFQYPDCHLPAVVLTEAGEPYETLQLTAVESYSGVTAYDRPLLAHLVKGTDWSSAVITEPKFFLPAVASGVGGLRLQTTADYWWLSKPDGVWRAPRAAGDPLDLTKDIVSLTQHCRPRESGDLTIVLDNSKGLYNVGAGLVPALINKRSEIVLKLGYKTTAGPESVASLHYWIDSWQYSTTQQTQSTLTLFCVDLWGLAFAWSARYSLRWNYTAFQPCRVWEILYQLLGRFGIRLWNNGGVPQSDPMNNYYPKFLSRGGTNAATQLRRLLDFVTDGLVPREALCFAKDLLATEASCYSYSTNPSNPTNSHPILKGEYGDNLTITHTQVSGDTEDEPPVHVREAAFDWPLLALGIDALVMQYDPNLEEADQAQKRADALLRTQQTQSTPATIIVPTNVGQELYDVVKVTDTRVGLTDKNFRVLAIQTDLDRRKGLYEQKLTLGAP
jgi:hypothetical protein